jgi:predicted HAD superfamily Cof-like phosphohydrolase
MKPWFGTTPTSRASTSRGEVNTTTEDNGAGRAVSNFELVREFHRAIGAPVPDAVRVPHPGRMRLRRALVLEEAQEVDAALQYGTVEGLAKELADLLVVTYGTAVEYGVPMDAVFAEVHRSNMSKVGGPVRVDGKLLKGDNYQPPNLAPLLAGPVRLQEGDDREIVRENIRRISADPLETIKKRPTISEVRDSEVLWLVAEVDRLRAQTDEPQGGDDDGRRDH